MPRPLVWVGVAYTLGAACAAGGFNIFFAAAGIVFCMWITGRIRQSWTEKWLFWSLPVFFLSGFVIFSHAMRNIRDNRAENQEAVLYGIVQQCEEKEKSNAITLSDVEIGGIKTKLLLYADKDQETVQVGDEIEVRGVLQKPERASNPGQFDPESYYYAKGISYMMRPDEMEVVSRGHSYRQLLQRLRSFWSERYNLFLDEKDAGVVKAVLVGDKSEMDEETEQLYIQAGIVHILAISGLHISIIGMGIFSLLKKAGAGLKQSACLSAFIVFSYGMLTGFGASTERAVIMFLVRMGAVYLGRTYDFLSAVSLAALIIFVSQPLALMQSGVWFSFGAVLSIGVLWPAMERCIPWHYDKMDNYKMKQLRKSMGISMSRREVLERIIRKIGPSAAVTIGTIPLTAYSYGAIPLVSFVLNLIVLPLMDIFVPAALLSGAVSLISNTAASFGGGSIHFILQLNRLLCEKMLQFPLSVWRTGVPPTAWIFIYYGLLVGFVLISLPKHQWWMRFARGAITEKMRFLPLVLCLFIFIPFRKMSPMAAFIDVGQGDGIFMRTTGGTTWLVDGGSSNVKEVGKYRILPFLNYYGEAEVDYACVTHSDADHISGIRELLLAKKIRHLVMTEVSKRDESSGELADLAAENGADVIYVSQGSCWESGGWAFECLYPGGEVKTDNINDQSMVLRVKAGETTFLLTGDLTSEVENEIDARKLEGTDVLKVAHHGSKYSGSDEFLEKLDAKLAVISCGKGNRYGHPAPETLKRLSAAHMRIEITMDVGAVIMPCKKGKFLLKTWLK